MKDARSLLLVLLSTGLVATWIYHLYDKSIYSHRRTEVPVKDSAAIADGIRDSLTSLFSATIRNLDKELDSSKADAGQLQTSLSIKLAEINRLRAEINSILRKNKATPADLQLAREKIRELQQKIEELRARNHSLEEERDRLGQVLAQLSDQVTRLEQQMLRLDSENQEMTRKISLAATFVASEINLRAIDIRGSRQQETSLARRTNAFKGSFVIQNHINSYPAATVLITLLKPDGTALAVEDSQADSQPGDAGYTRKFSLAYEKGEQKEISFTLAAGSPAKGTYTLQVWHNGLLIGQATKKLN